jgi:hypothetical protein
MMSGQPSVWSLKSMTIAQRFLPTDFLVTDLSLMKTIWHHCRPRNGPRYPAFGPERGLSGKQI